MRDPADRIVEMPHERSFFAALLSYLIPGLGQVYQGRVAKGVLFMVSLLGMFMLGLSMGDWRNVYLPREVPPASQAIMVGSRPINLGKPLANLWHRKSFAGQFWIGIAAWPAIWQFANMPLPKDDPFWQKLERAPTDEEQNEFLRASDKTPDLAWIYTVIAGVLNILVIYDAYAGPAFPSVRGKDDKDDNAAAEQAAVSKEAAVP